MKSYDLIAKHYDTFLAPLEKNFLDDMRKKYTALISGNTLDIAAGTGNNIKYYPENSQVTLLDSSKEMINVAKEKSYNRKDLTLNFENAKIEETKLPDNYFDTILSIDALCSVTNQEKAIKNMKRMLKKDGKIIFVEHMKTKSKLKNVLLYFTNLITYPTVKSSMTRNTLYNIKKHFLVQEIKELGYTFKYIRAKKKHSTSKS